jgi:hypothetical protein
VTAILWVLLVGTMCCAHDQGVVEPKVDPQEVGSIPVKEACWKGHAETRNTMPPLPHNPIVLPPNLADLKVDHRSVLLKLCLEPSGTVERVVVMKTSGNQEIDGYFVKEVAQLRFPPLRKNGLGVRSVVSVSFLLEGR